MIDERGTSNQIDLTDENQRLVNLKLLSLVKGFESGGMKGLFDKLPPSIKANSQFTYEGMRKAVNRDLKDLLELDGKSDELHKWLDSRKNSQMLQIRIMPDQFLLKNILFLLGTSFENIFENLPNTKELADIKLKTENMKDEFQTNSQLLKQMNKKLDELVYSLNSKRLRKNYVERYNDLLTYLLFFENIVLPSCERPNELGFSLKRAPEGETTSRAYNEIYAYDIFYLLYFFQNIHLRQLIHRLFNEMQTKTGNNIETGRLLCPLFMISAMIYFVKVFINSGIKNKRKMFTEEKAGVVFEFDDDNYSIEEDIYSKFSECEKRTKQLIKHVLESPVIPDEAICIEYEKTFVRFFTNTREIFEYPDPMKNIMSFIVLHPQKNELDKNIKQFFKKGLPLSFYVRKNGFDYLKEYPSIIDDLQEKLEKYYVGNEPTIETRRIDE
ncbi:MAG: hypothetical protein LBG22_07215 [Treponema sp.]|jgi:hypothetical protein|nr:hypothetical protein [Treponema sp.]